MSKLVWAAARIRDAGTNQDDASEIVISNVRTDGIDPDAGDGAQTVQIANSQDTTESYMRGFEIFVVGVNDDSGTAILSDDNVYSDPASDTLTKALIELEGETGADTVSIDDVYIQGENSLAEGRREVRLMCNLEAISDPYTFS